MFFMLLVFGVVWVWVMMLVLGIVFSRFMLIIGWVVCSEYSVGVGLLKFSLGVCSFIVVLLVSLMLCMLKFVRWVVLF